MKLIRKLGAVSQILQIFIRDSSSTTGAGLTGLVFNSAGLVAYYHRDTDTTATAISLVTMTVGTFTSSGFKEIDATNMPGWYQFCPPNAALASGAASVSFHLKGATNMAPLPIEIDLDAQVDVTSWNGTAVSSPATAGIPDVNVKNMNNVAATSITTINANQGTTQPFNFTGTAGSALVKSDMIDIASAAVSTSTAQIGVNAVNIGGTAQTGRDIGASVLLSPGTGTGQVDITSGVIKANLVQILATALTETAGQIAAGFKQFFNIASPTSTMNLITGTTTTTNLTNAASAGDFTAAMKTSLNAATPVASLSGDLTSTMKTSVENAVWNATTAGHTTAGSMGLALGNAGSSGDPWATALPGAYGAGTAGNIVGNRIDATVSSRSTYAGGAVASVTAGVTVSTNNDKTGYSLSSAGIQAVWDALTSALTTVGSIGKLLVTNIDAAISSRSTFAGGAVASVTGNVGGSVGSVTAGVTVSTNNDKTGYSLTQGFPANFSSLGISVSGHISTIDAYTGNTAQTGDCYARIGAAGAGLTALGDTRIANLDAAVSTRLATSGYTAPDNADIATILGVVNTNADTAGTTLLLSRVTSTRAGYMDNLVNLDATVSSRSTYAGGAVASVAGNVGGSVASVVAPVAITSNRKKGATATFEFTMTNAITGIDQTGLTVSCSISKDGGAFSGSANSVVEMANGWYKIVLTSGEMTANNIALQLTATGSATRDIAIQTQP